jgi:hypothetical protein
MEHAEARELLELAAVEPDGFERLAAGDTPEASALAGHIAGCLECGAEMERLRRAAQVIRAAVRTAPPPELRERTLAYVAAVGRPRGPAAVAGGAPTLPVASGAGGVAALPRLTLAAGLWAASIAAALILAIIGTSVVLQGSRDAVAEAQATQIAALAKVASWSLRIDGEPDAESVKLVAAAGAPGLSGTLSFSPGTRELVVLAEGLAQPPTGMQYRCWVEVDGSRRRIGQMFFGGDVAFWVGAVDEVAGVEPGTRFGITLVPADGDSLSGEPVLLGGL